MALLVNIPAIDPTWLGHQAAVRVWAFDKAPRPLQTLCSRTGDEIWIALVPPSCECLPSWISSQGFDMRCEPEVIDLADGWKVLVGCRA